MNPRHLHLTFHGPCTKKFPFPPPSNPPPPPHHHHHLKPPPPPHAHTHALHPPRSRFPQTCRLSLRSAYSTEPSTDIDAKPSTDAAKRGTEAQIAAVRVHVEAAVDAAPERPQPSEDLARLIWTAAVGALVEPTLTLTLPSSMRPSLHPPSLYVSLLAPATAAPRLPAPRQHALLASGAPAGQKRGDP